MNEKSTVHNGHFTKIDRYKWIPQGQRGELRWLKKKAIDVDPAYQRGLNKDKARQIASGFSWAAFGTLVVVERPDGFFVIDGQHRHEAALNRADVDEVPCIVFTMDSSSDEAKAFLSLNTLRKPLSGYEKHRAEVEAGDPISVMVSQLIESVGRKAASNHQPHGVACVAAMTRLARTDGHTLQRLWPVVHAVAGDAPLDHRLLEGLMWIEGKLNPDDTLCNQRWRKRLVEIGGFALVRGAMQMSGGLGVGGAAVWGKGMVRVINKKLRARMTLPGVDMTGL